MPDRIGLVTASSLNLRPAPSTDQDPLAGLPRGTRLQVLDRQDSWLRVRAADLEGFVSADFVRIIDSNPAAGFLRERDDLRNAPLLPGRLIILPAAPNSSQLDVARAWNSEGGLVAALSDAVEIPAAASIAVLCVESSGEPFAADGRMIIRFENHIFFREWGKNHPDKFNDHFRFDPDEHFKGHQFRDTPDAPFKAFHGRQPGEWKAFEFARNLDEPAAIRSISMGLAQVMGFNFHQLGYESPRDMFDAFQADVRFQILGMFDFIKGPGTTSRMLEALQRQDFQLFASLYNGPGQVAEYAARISGHVEACENLLA
jgi:hypothetical protein